MSELYAPFLSTLITQAVERLQVELQRYTPFMGERVYRWMCGLAGDTQPAAYFQHPLAYPIFLLPYWLEKALRDQVDEAFQGDLIYSSMNIYYFIRLIDNVMDEDGAAEKQLLPALGFFHSQWQSSYQRHFHAQHPFWSYFMRVWSEACEITLKDAMLHEIDFDSFIDISGKKVYAARIPCAAVCYYYERLDTLETWQPFYDRLERWHQMYNDVFGWIGDFQNQTPTYFLSEAQRRKQSDETPAAWIAREGFAWASEVLLEWLMELQTLASGLDSPELEAYLRFREKLYIKQCEAIQARLAQLAQLLDAVKG